MLNRLVYSLTQVKQFSRECLTEGFVCLAYSIAPTAGVAAWKEPRQ